MSPIPCPVCHTRVDPATVRCPACHNTLPRASTGEELTDTLNEFGAAPATPLHVGEVLLGRFDVREELGAGPLGSSYRARDRTSGAQVALKVVAEALLVSDEEGREFLSKIEGFCGRSVPGCVMPLEALATSVGAVVVSPWLDAVSLRDVLVARASKGLRFTQEEALRVLQALVSATQAMHSASPHGCVRPENVLVSSRGLFLTEPGLGVTLSPDRIVVSLSRRPELMPYLAPEVGRARRPTAAADLYALGAIAGELLGGGPPGNGCDVAAIAPEVHRAIVTLLDRDAGKRPAGLRQLLDATARAAGFAQRPPDPALTVPELVLEDIPARLPQRHAAGVPPAKVQLHPTSAAASAASLAATMAPGVHSSRGAHGAEELTRVAEMPLRPVQLAKESPSASAAASESPTRVADVSGLRGAEPFPVMLAVQAQGPQTPPPPSPSPPSPPADAPPADALFAVFKEEPEEPPQGAPPPIELEPAEDPSDQTTQPRSPMPQARPVLALAEEIDDEVDTSDLRGPKGPPVGHRLDPDEAAQEGDRTTIGPRPTAKTRRSTRSVETDGLGDRATAKLADESEAETAPGRKPPSTVPAPIQPRSTAPQDQVVARGKTPERPATRSMRSAKPGEDPPTRAPPSAILPSEPAPGSPMIPPSTSGRLSSTTASLPRFKNPPPIAPAGPPGGLLAKSGPPSNVAVKSGPPPNVAVKSGPPSGVAVRSGPPSGLPSIKGSSASAPPGRAPEGAGPAVPPAPRLPSFTSSTGSRAPPPSAPAAPQPPAREARAAMAQPPRAPVSGQSAPPPRSLPSLMKPAVRTNAPTTRVPASQAKNLPPPPGKGPPPMPSGRPPAIPQQGDAPKPEGIDPRLLRAAQHLDNERGRPKKITDTLEVDDLEIVDE